MAMGRLSGLVLGLVALSSSPMLAPPLAAAQPAPPIDTTPYPMRSHLAIDDAPAGPSQIPYADGDPVPEGYRVEQDFNSGLFAAGVAIFGFSYIMSVLLAASDVSLVESSRETAVHSRRNNPLYAPLIGPPIALAMGERPGSEMALLVADGLVQATGVALLSVGLGTRQQWLVRAVPGRIAVTALF